MTLPELQRYAPQLLLRVLKSRHSQAWIQVHIAAHLQLQLNNTWQGAASARHSTAAPRLPWKLRQLYWPQHQQACGAAAGPGRALLMQRLLWVDLAAVDAVLVVEGPSS